MKYSQILSQAVENPWAILPAKLEQIMAFLRSKAAGNEISAETVAALKPPKQPEVQTFERICIIPMRGTISPRANMMSDFSGGVSAELLARDIRAAAADAGIDTIVLDVDSPGGNVLGIPDAAAAVAEARAIKPVVAVVGGMAASAAYWIAANATEIVLPAEGQVGSIGVFKVHEDESEAMKKEGVKVTIISAGKYKVEGNPYEPLSKEAMAYQQGQVDKLYDMFVSDVAKGRGRQVAEVAGGFGQGRMLLGRDAIAAGMADRIGTMRSTITRLLRPRSTAGLARASNMTVREFEAFLRDEGGFSAEAAKKITAAGYKSESRDGAPSEKETANPELLVELRRFTDSVGQ